MQIQQKQPPGLTYYSSIQTIEANAVVKNALIMHMKIKSVLANFSIIWLYKMVHISNTMDYRQTEVRKTTYLETAGKTSCNLQARGYTRFFFSPAGRRSLKPDQCTGARKETQRRSKRSHMGLMYQEVSVLQALIKITFTITSIKHKTSKKDNGKT